MLGGGGPVREAVLAAADSPHRRGSLEDTASAGSVVAGADGGRAGLALAMLGVLGLVVEVGCGHVVVEHEVNYIPNVYPVNTLFELSFYPTVALDIYPQITHPMPVSDPFLEIKVKPTAEQKAVFKAAAEASKPFPLSLGKWLLLAGIEKAERDGAVKKKGGK